MRESMVESPSPVRLVELLAALSLVTDLARGHPPGEAMRACLLATHLAAKMRLSILEQSAIYYTTLLRFVGCTATSEDYAETFGGNDILARARGDLTDFTITREAIGFLAAVSAGNGPPLERVRRLARAAARAKRTASQGAREDCEVSARMAYRLDLGSEVSAALGEVFERWDGRGAPNAKRGEAIALPARFAAVAYAAVMFDAIGGSALAEEMVKKWSSRALDPSIARLFDHEALVAATPDDVLPAVARAEPGDAKIVSDLHFDDMARAFADVVDLKSRYLHGHSTGVAALADGAGRLLGLSADRVVILRRAALLHDLGRVGVATGVWDKPARLSVAEWELVRLHPYHTTRILSRTPALEPLGRLAGLHHERLDGSGYPHQAPPAMLDTSARTLAAADTYHALTEPRPHRPAFSPNEAARILDTESLDREAVGAVLEAAGQRQRRQRAEYPAGLTPREVDVLRRLVRGLSEKQIAAELVVSPATVHTHIAHVYQKAGVSTRAGAAVFAMENDLIRD